MLQLIQKANSFKPKTAIISNGQQYNYGQLLNDSERIASALLGKTQDLEEARIAFMVSPSYEYVAVQWGVWMAGGIAVPLCTAHPVNALKYTLENSQTSRLIVAREHAETLWETAEELSIEIILLEDILQTTQTGTLPNIQVERTAMLLYTSGTTSQPKGVMITHTNLENQLSVLSEAWQWQETDHILNVLPLHHVHGIVNILSCALWNGAICEFMPKFDAQQVWSLFRLGKLNLFMAVPTIYSKLIQFWEDAQSEEKEKMTEAVSKFRLMVSGSAALPVSFLEKWQQISGHTLLERYGMTEIGMAISNPYDSERKAGFVGKPLPTVSVRLVDDTGDLARAGMSGEIQIKGPSVFKGYWKKYGATEEAFTADGWFKSGDIAILENGYYKILGRNSVDIIKSGGYKISALAIEEVLRQHPDIQECAVVGMPNEEWGEVIVASIISKSLQEEDLATLGNWAKNYLPSYQIPRHFILLNSLPRNTIGKITKNELKTVITEKLDL